MTLAVGPGVFIPRPETEALLEWALAQRLPDRAGDRRPVHRLGRARRWRWRTRTTRRPRHRRRGLRRGADYARRNCAGRDVELVEADVTVPGSARRARRRRRPARRRIRRTSPTARHWNPKWPNMTRPTRCSAAPTGWRSSGRSSAWPRGCCAPGGRVAVEHDDDTAAPTVALFERVRARSPT